MAKQERDILKLLMKLIGHKTGEISNVEYSPQKPLFPEDNEGETFLPRSTPEEMGVDSAFLLGLFEKLYCNNSCHIHKVMAIRNGHVIGEFCASPFEKDVWHVTHSMCKSVTGMAIGFLVTEGKLKLDDKVAEIFSSRKNPLQLVFSNGMTVRHLLTMTSGVSFNESGAISGNDWRKLFLEAQQKNAPGSVFEYNSMNSYMLSAIVTELTGESMLEYLKPRLFEPLGIKRVFWETCPQNITKGGWGMFMRIEDMAKLGILYLNKGMYDGKQILPEEWVLEATKPQVETKNESSPGYGYQLWTGVDREGAYTFNGMLGQNVYCYPDLNMIIVTNAGNDDLFQAGNMSRIIRGEMADIKVSDAAIEVDEKTLAAQKKLNDFILEAEGKKFKNALIYNHGFKNRKLVMTKGSSKRHYRNVPLSRKQKLQGDSEQGFERILKKCLNGCIYDMDDKGVGVMPLLMQVMHNNYTDGISSIGFEYDDRSDAFYMIIKEGEKEIKLKCCSRENPTYTDVDEHGESYRLSVISEFSTDEYNRPVLRNEFYFVEDSTTRVMNIYFGKREPLQHGICFDKNKPAAPDNIGIRFDEIPGSGMLFGILDQFGSLEQIKGITGIFVSFINDYGAIDALTLAIRDTVRPKLHGKLRDAVGISQDLGYYINTDENSISSENEAITEDD
jgi:CubicO group peptidase (beta-lactamase class C family)